MGLREVKEPNGPDYGGHWVCSHPNGTRYEIITASDPEGGCLVSWPGGRWFGRVDLIGTPRIITYAGSLPRPDLKALRQIVCTKFDHRGRKHREGGN